jgi:uncharacterized protein
VHYQAAVAQFAATMIMTILRLVIHRRSAPRPVLDYNPCRGESLNTFGIVELDEGHELNRLAKRLTGCREWSVSTGPLWNHTDLQEDYSSNSMARKVLQNKLRLKELCGNFESVQTFADRVGETMDGIMNYIWTTRLQSLDDNEQLHWSIRVATTGDVYSSAKLDISLFRSGDKWRVDRAAIEAILDLWIWQLHDHGLQDSGNNLWLLSFDDEQNCEFSQALFDLLNPTSVRLEPVLDVAETCRQLRVDHRRVLYSEMMSTSQTSKKRAMIGQSDLHSMCAQYLIMAFLSRMATYIQKPRAPLSLSVDSKSHGIRVEDPIFDTFRSILRHSGLATEEDSSKITFCALVQTGKLLDPLSLLPQLVTAAGLQKGIEIRKTCSRICQLFKWNATTLASKGLLVEAGELGLSVIGAFTEVFGYQQDETQNVRQIAQEVILAIESGRHNIKISTHYTQQDSDDEKSCQGLAPECVSVDVADATHIDEKERLVNVKAMSIKDLTGIQPSTNWNNQDQVAAKLRALDEEAFKTAICVGDIENVRMGLLFDCADYPKFLSNGIITAFDALKKDFTFERTEIIRLLVLSGSGHDFGYRFNITTLLDCAAQAGNINLGELLLGKTEKSHYQLDVYKAVGIAIEYDQERFVRFLLDSQDNVNINDRKGTNALRHAAYYGRENVVKYLISLGANIQGQPNDMDNALSLAASRKHDSLGRFLIQQEILISKGVGFRYQRGQTSLHFVARTGNINLVQALLDAGWDVNAGEREVPLKEAMRHGYEHVANFLIKKGSKIDEGLLHQAAEKGLISTAKLLISMGADVNALDRQRRPLLEAARQGPKEKYEGFLKLLIENGARVDVKDSTGISVLLQASNAGHESVSKLFLEAGAPLTERRADGTTVVHSAAKYGHVEMIRALVKRGVELDTRDDNMQTPLNFAAGGGHTDVIRILLEVKPGDWVNGNSSDEYRQPPLHDAINGGHLEAARLLVENRASIAGHDFIDWRYSSPLYIAVRSQKSDIVQMFMGEGGGTLNDIAFGEIVKEAVERGHLATITAVLSGETARQIPGKPLQATQHLPHASLRCKIEVVKLLLELGADVSDNKALNECIQCSDNQNFNNWKEWYDISKILFLHNPMAAAPLLPLLLRTAATRNNVDGVRFWLSHDAPIETRYEDSKTILHYAAAADAAECLPLLLEANAREEFVNARSRSGTTALHAAVSGVKMYAASDSHLGVVKMLVGHGANPSLRARDDKRAWVDERGSEEGITALDMARKANLGLIVKFLEGVSR